MATRSRYQPSSTAAQSAARLASDEAAYLRAKRICDVLVSGALLLVLSPILAVVALLVKLDSPGPVFYSHERMGYDWRSRRLRTFKMHKFRSMFDKCDQSLHEQHIRDWVRMGPGTDGSNGGPRLVKLTRDPRITRVGRFIRKTSIDELPQLWNVLRGEMSLVGPRPVPLYEVEEYQPWHRRRLEATPGITCVWQVRGRGLVGLDDMVRMDLEYLEQRSLWLDFKLLMETIPVVLSGRGAA